jgi:hypothetical protein
MKRILVGVFAMTALLVGGGIALAAPAPLPGTPDDSTIKACADYSLSPHSDGTYNQTTGSLSFKVVLADYMCKNVTYSFFAYAGTSTTGSVLFQDIRPGDSANYQYVINTTVAGTPPANVCVYATTTKSNGTLQDRAPDAAGSCYPVPTAGSAGGSGMW